MEVTMYSIYDTEAKSYTAPFYQETTAGAIRQFVLAMEKVPEFVQVALELQSVGSIDMDKCKVSDCANRTVFRGKDLKAWLESHKVLDKEESK